ncbi:hypothetical protein BC828DRAFT_435810 [Blastocladiella britannica]|nr:hypothetical protein BC828DRAFT_435810 [Blastocladiella britannica]
MSYGSSAAAAMMAMASVAADSPPPVVQRRAVTGYFAGMEWGALLLTTNGASHIQLYQIDPASFTLIKIAECNLGAEVRGLERLRLNATSAASKDYILAALDGGAILILEYNPKNVTFELVDQEQYQGTHHPWLSWGRNMTADWKSRCVLIGNVEECKIVHILIDPAETKLSVALPTVDAIPSSPLFAVVSVESPWRNPIFACLEAHRASDKSAMSAALSSAAAASAYRDDIIASADKMLVFYELDLEQNQVFRRWDVRVDSSANMVIPVPSPIAEPTVSAAATANGGANNGASPAGTAPAAASSSSSSVAAGPGGVLVCSRNMVVWYHERRAAQSVPIPRHPSLTLGAELYLVSHTAVRGLPPSGTGCAVLAQSIFGDIYLIEFRDDVLSIKFFDSVPQTEQLFLLSNRFLLACALFEHPKVYYLVSVGDGDDDPDQPVYSALEPTDPEDAVFRPRSLRHLTSTATLLGQQRAARAKQQHVLAQANAAAIQRQYSVRGGPPPSALSPSEMQRRASMAAMRVSGLSPQQQQHQLHLQQQQHQQQPPRPGMYVGTGGSPIGQRPGSPSGGGRSSVMYSSGGPGPQFQMRPSGMMRPGQPQHHPQQQQHPQQQLGGRIAIAPGQPYIPSQVSLGRQSSVAYRYTGPPPPTPHGTPPHQGYPMSPQMRPGGYAPVSPYHHAAAQQMAYQRHPGMYGQPPQGQGGVPYGMQPQGPQRGSMLVPSGMHPSVAMQSPPLRASPGPPMQDPAAAAAAAAAYASRASSLAHRMPHPAQQQMHQQVMVGGRTASLRRPQSHGGLTMAAGMQQQQQQFPNGGAMPGPIPGGGPTSYGPSPALQYQPGQQPARMSQQDVQQQQQQARYGSMRRPPGDVSILPRPASDPGLFVDGGDSNVDPRMSVDSGYPPSGTSGGSASSPNLHRYSSADSALPGGNGGSGDGDATMVVADSGNASFLTTDLDDSFASTGDATLVSANGGGGEFGAPDSMGPTAASAASGGASDSATLSLEKRLKQLELRSYVAHEMYETEVSYRESLKILLTQFKQPLEEQKLVPKVFIRLVFTGVEALLEFSTQFAKELAVVMDSWDDEQSIMAPLFLAQGEGFSVFLRFVDNYSNALAMVRRAEESNAGFKQFNEKCKHSRDTNRQQLQDFLILPIQRATRYPLLLKDVRKHTPTDHPDYEHLTSALGIMNEMAAQVNHVKQQEEEMTRMFTMFKQVEGCPPIVIKYSRRLILEVDAGEVTGMGAAAASASGVAGSLLSLVAASSKHHPLRLYLMSDLLLLARVHKKGKVKFIRLLDLADLTASEGGSGMVVLDIRAGSLSTSSTTLNAKAGHGPSAAVKSAVNAFSGLRSAGVALGSGMGGGGGGGGLGDAASKEQQLPLSYVLSLSDEKGRQGFLLALQDKIKSTRDQRAREGGVFSLPRTVGAIPVQGLDGSSTTTTAPEPTVTVPVGFGTNSSAAATTSSASPTALSSPMDGLPALIPLALSAALDIPPGMLPSNPRVTSGPAPLSPMAEEEQEVDSRLPTITIPVPHGGDATPSSKAIMTIGRPASFTTSIFPMHGDQGDATSEVVGIDHALALLSLGDNDYPAAAPHQAEEAELILPTSSPQSKSQSSSALTSPVTATGPPLLPPPLPPKFKAKRSHSVPVGGDASPPPAVPAPASAGHDKSGDLDGLSLHGGGMSLSLPRRSATPAAVTAVDDHV